MQAVNEHCLQLVDILRRLYGDAEFTRRAQESIRLVGLLKATLAKLAVAGEAAASHGPLSLLANVKIAILRREAVVVLMQPLVEVMVALRARAVTGALRRAVGHHAGLQAAVPSHGLVEVQSGDQWLSDVDAFGPAYGRIILHGCKGALKTHGENQLLL